MKKWFAAALLVLAVVFSFACAEEATVEPMPADWIVPEVFDGLELVTGPGMTEDEEGNMVEGEVVEGYGVFLEDGYLKIVIDTEKTDWDKVIPLMLNVEYGEVSWGPYISTGEFIRDDSFNVVDFEGPVYVQAGGTSEGNDANIIEMFSGDEIPSAEELANRKNWLMENEEYPTIEHSVGIGRYNETSATFEPWSVNDFYIAARCFNEDGSYYYQKLKVEVEFTSEETVQLEEPIGRYPASDIVAAYDYSGSDVVATVANGNVRYHVNTEVICDETKDFELETYVLCPDASVETTGGVGGDWNCMFFDYSGIHMAELETISVNGKDRLAAKLPNAETRNARNDNSPEALFIRWIKSGLVYDEGSMDGEYVESVESQGTLIISVHEQGVEKWVKYVEPSRVMLEEMNGLVAELHTSGNQWKIWIDEEATDWETVAADPANFEEGKLRLFVGITAPGGATHNAGFGTGAHDDERILEMLKEETPSMGKVFWIGVWVGTVNDGVFERDDFSNEINCVQWSDGKGNIALTEKMVYGTVWGDDEGGEGGEGGPDITLPIVDPNGEGVFVNNMDAEDADRCGFIQIEGMVARMDFDAELGHWVMTIDNKATDWEKVFSTNYDADMKTVLQSFYQIGPEGTAYHRSTGTSVQDDSELLEMLTRVDWGSNSDTSVNGDFLGTYIEESKLFQPTVREDQVRVMVAQWFDSDLNYLGTDKFMFSIRFTDTLPVTVATSKIPAEQIVCSEDGDPVVTTSLGSARFEYPMGEGTAQLETFVICPAYFDDDPNNDPGFCGDDTYTSGWSCTSAELGDEWEADLQWLTTSIPNADGSETMGHYLVARVGSAPIDLWREHASTRSYNVVWYQDQETDDGMTRVPVQRGTLIQTHVVGEPDEWPIYIDELSPVTLNATDITAVNAVEGLNAEFENGVLRIGVDDDKLPSGKDLSQANFTVRVTPPLDANGKPAVYYKENRSGGSNIFDWAEESWEDQQDHMEWAEYRSVADEPYELYIVPCSRYTSKINDQLTLSIYLSNEITPEFAGDVNLIYWYGEDGDDEDEEPDLISRQYLIERYDPIMRIEESVPYEDESQITGTIEVPAIVVFEQGGRHKYTLRITSYPQDAGNMIYYDLALVDKKGNEVELADLDKHNNKRCKIYMPYPDGHNSGTNVKYNIHHLNSKHHAKEYFSEDDEAFKIYRTEYGLCIEVNDLSPFVLSWGNAWSGGTSNANVLALPESLELIKEEAFMDGAFDEVVIPDGCIAIGVNAFANVENLVVHMPDNDELIIGENAFDYETATFIVPDGSLAHRMAVENWWNYEIKYY